MYGIITINKMKCNNIDNNIKSIRKLSSMNRKLYTASTSLSTDLPSSIWIKSLNLM